MKPERALLYLLALWLLTGVIAAFVPQLTTGALVFGLAIAVVAAIDAAIAWRQKAPLAQRSVSSTLALRSKTDVSIELHNDSRASVDAWITDHYPASGEVERAEQRVSLQPGQNARMVYSFTPLRRGRAEFGDVEMFCRSPLRLWRARKRGAEPSAVSVYPDFRGVRRFAILAVADVVGATGVKKRQRRGEGLELHQLREYRDGDTLRQVDWKATSRRRALISREYQDERNQQVVFLLDCGLHMRTIDEGLPHFDAALDGMLSLAYVAVRQGDAVGMMAAGADGRWLAPQKGPGATTALLKTLYDLDPTHQVPDYLSAAMQLVARQRRRSLVVIVTSLRAEDSEEILMAVRLLRRRHLVIVASLRETFLDAAIERPIEHFDDALRFGALHHYIDDRRRAFRALDGRGVYTLDVAPNQLAVSMVNRYLDVKRSGAL